MYSLFQVPPVSLVSSSPSSSLFSFFLPSLPSSPLKSSLSADFWATLRYYHWPSSEPIDPSSAPVHWMNGRSGSLCYILLVYIVCSVLPTANKDDCHPGDLSDPAFYQASQPTGRIAWTMFRCAGKLCQGVYPGNLINWLMLLHHSMTCIPLNEHTGINQL